MSLQELDAGLYRWTADHPDWRSGADPGSPSDWPQAVGCVLAATDEATVFIDPLVGDGDDLWQRLDAHVAVRRLPVVVLTTIEFHSRSRDDLAGRYGATVLGAGDDPPAGVEALRLERAEETLFWLPEYRALVPGDCLLGDDDGGVRVCPQSWLDDFSDPPTREELARTLEPLLDWPIEKVLVSHGEPVLSGGRDAIASALSAAAG